MSNMVVEVDGVLRCACRRNLELRRLTDVGGNVRPATAADVRVLNVGVRREFARYGEPAAGRRAHRDIDT